MFNNEGLPLCQIGFGYVRARVIEIDTEKGWLYQSCSRCFKKVKKAGDKHYCDKGDQIVIAVPRY